MPRSLRPASAVALVVSLMLALTSCGDDPPNPDPFDPSDTPVSSSPTATESPKPVTPEQAIHDFVRAEAEMQATGESQGFLALSFRCGYCRRQAKLVTDLYKAGGYVRTNAPIKVDFTKLRDGESSQTFKVFDVQQDLPAERFRMNSGAKEQHAPPLKDVKYIFRLVRRPDGWKITEVTSLEENA